MAEENEVQGDAGASTEGSSTQGLTIRGMQQYIGEWSMRKGWQVTDPKELPVKLFLIVTEITEAFEEYRNGRAPNEVYYAADKQGFPKPEGIGIEVADAMIRILHFCNEFNLDLEKLVMEKMTYNETRPYKHGGKVV